MIFSLLYNGALFLFLLVMFPQILYQRIFKGKRYPHLFKRVFGIGYPVLKREEKQRIFWIHGVSVGEVKSLFSLLQKIKKTYPTSQVVVTTTTHTGYEEAKRTLQKADYHCYLPFDFSFAAKRFIKNIHPDVMIFAEGDLWYHFLKQGHKENAQIFLVSGKLSEKSYNRFKIFPWIQKRLVDPINLLCLQNTEYEKRYLQLGIEKEKISVTGNLKYDAPTTYLSPEDKSRYKDLFQMGHSFCKAVTLSCTHFPEEKMLLSALRTLFENNEKNLTLFLAPRHPERFQEVKKTLESMEISFSSLSALTKETDKKNVYLIDQMGFLPVCYQLSDLTVMGGSFIDKVGGHNILEPLFYDVPVLFGPSMFTQQELKRLVLQAGCGFQTDVEQLSNLINHLLYEKETERLNLQLHAKTLIKNIKGATDLTWDVLHHEIRSFS